MKRRVTFTDGELRQLRRAVALIATEDHNCRVNMDPAAVADKMSALKKLNKLTNYTDPFADFTHVLDVRTGKVTPK